MYSYGTMMVAHQQRAHKPAGAGMRPDEMANGCNYGSHRGHNFKMAACKTVNSSLECWCMVTVLRMANDASIIADDEDIYRLHALPT